MGLVVVGSANDVFDHLTDALAQSIVHGIYGPLADIVDERGGRGGRGHQSWEGEGEMVRVDEAVLQSGPESGQDQLFQFGDICDRESADVVMYRLTLKLCSATQERGRLQVEMKVGQQAGVKMLSFTMGVVYLEAELDWASAGTSRWAT